MSNQNQYEQAQVSLMTQVKSFALGSSRSMDFTTRKGRSESPRYMMSEAKSR